MNIETLSSTFCSLHVEFQFLKKFFGNNGFATCIVDRFIYNFLNRLYTDTPKSVTVPKKDFFFKLPYFGCQSDKLKQELVTLLNKYYPFVNFRAVLTNHHTIGSLFHHKDKLPLGLRSSVVYLFQCAQGGTPVAYVGSTARHLYQRVAEHAGRSFRTGKPLSKPAYSSIKAHADQCGCDVTLDSFKILATTNDPNFLRLLESLYIHTLKPAINDTLSACPLLTM